MTIGRPFGLDRTSAVNVCGNFAARHQLSAERYFSVSGVGRPTAKRQTPEQSVGPFARAGETESASTSAKPMRPTPAR